MGGRLAAGRSPGARVGRTGGPAQTGRTGGPAQNGRRRDQAPTAWAAHLSGWPAPRGDPQGPAGHRSAAANTVRNVPMSCIFCMLKLSVEKDNGVHGASCGQLARMAGQLAIIYSRASMASEVTPSPLASGCSRAFTRPPRHRGHGRAGQHRDVSCRSGASAIPAHPGTSSAGSGRPRQRAARRSMLSSGLSPTARQPRETARSASPATMSLLAGRPATGPRFHDPVKIRGVIGPKSYVPISTERGPGAFSLSDIAHRTHRGGRTRKVRRCCSRSCRCRTLGSLPS